MLTQLDRKLTLFLYLILIIIIGASCAFKVGNYSLSETTKRKLEQTSSLHNIEDDRLWLGVDLFTPRFFYKKIDVLFSVGFNSYPEGKPITTIEGEIVSHPSTTFRCYSIGTRIYPLGGTVKTIEPMIGGGIGYYDYSHYETTLESWGGDAMYSWYRERVVGKTIASGFCPYLTMGIYFFPKTEPLEHKMRFALFVEYRYNFVKNLNSYGGNLDIAGNQVMLGLGFFSFAW